MPTKLAQEMTNLDTPIEVQEILKKEIYELLNELSSEQFANKIEVDCNKVLMQLHKTNS